MWQCHPMREKRAPLKYERVFSQPEFEKLACGVVPEDIDDRWFIFFEHGSVYFHRSWSGECLFFLRLRKLPDSYEVLEAFVNRDPELYKSTDDEFDAKFLAYLVESYILGKEHPFPLVANVRPEDQPAARNQLMGRERKR
jgi:hypothetical protein